MKFENMKNFLSILFVFFCLFQNLIAQVEPPKPSPISDGKVFCLYNCNFQGFCSSYRKHQFVIPQIRNFNATADSGILRYHTAKAVVQNTRKQFIGEQIRLTPQLEMVENLLYIQFRQQIQPADPLPFFLANIPGNFKDHRA